MPMQSSLAADCWLSNDKTAWQAHLDAYPLRISQLGKDRLPDLERLFTELGPKIRSRRVAHVTAIELVKIVEWKLTRGKWRPRLLDFAKAHNESTVVAATTTSFRRLDEGDIAAALSNLTKLKGIGPATASAILSAYAPEICPFMSDEAAAVALPGVKLKYNRQEYERLSAALCAKSEHLNSTGDRFETYSSTIPDESLTYPFPTCTLDWMELQGSKIFDKQRLEFHQGSTEF